MATKSDKDTFDIAAELIDSAINAMDIAADDTALHAHDRGVAHLVTLILCALREGDMVSVHAYTAQLESFLEVAE